MNKNLFIFNSSEKYGSKTFFRNIIKLLPDDDYFVISKYDKQYMGGKKNLIISPDGFKKNIFNQLFLPVLIFKLNIKFIYTNSMISIFFAGKKNILSVRNVDPFLNNYKINFKYKLKLFLIRFLFKISNYFSHKIIFVSNFSYNVALSFMVIKKEKKILAYHGIDHIEKNISTKDIDIIFVGKFIHYHNLNLVLSSLEKLKKNKDFKYKLVLGDFDTNLKKEIVTRYNLRNNKDIIYNLKNTEVTNLMKRSKILLFSSSYEACPFTLLEAMRCSCAVVSSDSGPNREILRNNGVFFDLKSEVDMYLKMNDLLGDEVKIKNLSSINSHNSDIYKWSETTKNIMNL